MEEQYIYIKASHLEELLRVRMDFRLLMARLEAYGRLTYDEAIDICECADEYDEALSKAAEMELARNEGGLV